MQQYSLDKSKLTDTFGADPVMSGAVSRFKYVAVFGISYTTKKLQVGASVSQLVQSKLNFYKANIAVTEEARLYRHYYFNALYHWNVDQVTVISPNTLFIY